MASVVKFKLPNVPRQQGEIARLKVLQGPDYGSVYVLTGVRAAIGRGEDCDAMLTDLKASRRHAELIFTQGQGWRVKDLGSSNGILHNGGNTREASLKNRDTIALGETTLEFLTGEANTAMLLEQPKGLVQVQVDNSALAAQRERVRAMGSFGGGARPGPSSSGGPAPAKKAPNPLLIIALVGGAAVFLFMDDGQAPKRPRPTPKPSESAEAERNLAAYLPGADFDGVFIQKQAEVFFREGFREFRERNFLRARQSFETVLQIAPGHPLASRYLDNCRKEMDEEIRFHLKNGSKGLEAGKYKEARGHFEAVLRLLNRDQSNPAYIEAKSQLDKAKKQLSTTEGSAG